jgi:hypothetical protein
LGCLACPNCPPGESERTELLDEALHLRITPLKWHFVEPEPLNSGEFLLVEGYWQLAASLDDIPERNVPMSRG